MLKIMDAIDNAFWFEFLREGFDQYSPEIKFKIRLLSFEIFNFSDIDNYESVHYSLNPNNGLFYLLKAEFLNCSESNVSFSEIGNLIYLADQNGFRYYSIQDNHLSRDSRFAELHGIYKGRDNLYIPGISRVGSVAFFLPPYEGQHYSITSIKSMIQQVSSATKAIAHNNQDGSINIDYAIDSYNWFTSTPDLNNVNCNNSIKFDIRIISFQALVCETIDYEKVDPQFPQNSGGFHILEFEIVIFEKKELWLWELYGHIHINNEVCQHFSRVYDEYIYSIAGDKYKALNYFNRNTRFMPKIKGRGAFLYFLPKEDCKYSIANNIDNLKER